MTRVLAAVLLCAASSVGCSALNQMNANAPKGTHLVNSQSAPRPSIERQACQQPDVSLCSACSACGEHCGCAIDSLGGGRGCGMVGCGCDDVVNGCVDAVLDCNGCGMGCGDACGDCCGSCGPCGCGPCAGGGCLQNLGACSCGGMGQCGCCMKLRQMLACGCQCRGQGVCRACCVARSLAKNCVCGGVGQCACCQHMRTLVGGPHAANTDASYAFNQGPPSAQVAYPYYTNRGPRDFFLDNPPSIGPY